MGKWSHTSTIQQYLRGTKLLSMCFQLHMEILTLQWRVAPHVKSSLCLEYILFYCLPLAGFVFFAKKFG